MAVHDGLSTRACRIHLTKGARDRVEEDAVASRLVLRGLAQACGLPRQAQSLSLGLHVAGGGGGGAAAAQQNGVADGVGTTGSSAYASTSFEQLQVLFIGCQA